MKTLMDRFNAMVASVSAAPSFAHVHYLDHRGTLLNDGTYKKYWASGLHLTGRGFDLVTAKFAVLIVSS